MSEQVEEPSGVSRYIAPVAKAAAAMAVFVVAIYALHRFSREVNWSDVKTDLSAQSWDSILLAVAATGLSYLAMAFYDVLGTATAAPGKVPPRIAFLAGSTGYAVTNLLGFSWLTGGAVRYRLYSSYGLDLVDIAQVIANVWLSFWLGLMTIVAALFLFHPSGLSAAFQMTPQFERVAGVLLVIAIAVFFVWLGRKGRRIHVRSYQLRFPTGFVAASQTVVAIIDVLGAALCLYVLLPGDLTGNFALFFVVFVSAMGLGVASHSPGGVGVFEATIIGGLGAIGRPDMLAGLVLFRMVYYVLPFVVAAAVLASASVYAMGRKHRDALPTLRRALMPVMPAIAAGVVLLAGALLLVSGSLPGETNRLLDLRDLVPLPFIEASHLLASIAGLLLIIVAHGLYLRSFRAWLVAIGLLSLGLVTSLTKGLDWEEAVTMAAALALLASFRAAFYRYKHAIFQLEWHWALASALFLAVSIWVGFFAYSKVPYSNDLLWQFTLHGDAPRFLRAALATSVIFLAIGLNSFLKASPKLGAGEPVPQRVRELIAASPDTEAAIALTGDKRFMLSDDGNAFISYADGGTTLISKGDPVGDEQSGTQLAWKLREHADRLGKKCAFYAVGEKYLPVYLDMGMSILKIGEVARVDLRRFTLDGASRANMRNALHRAEREGYVFAVLPAAEIVHRLPELRRVSDAWLAERQGREKGFALGAFSEDYLVRFDHAVLQKGEGGEIVAFANILTGAGHHEASVDLMRFDPGGPRYAMDALFAHLMLWAKAEGYGWFSLGAAPLSGLSDHPLSPLWSRLGSYIYRYGDNLYHFEGLRAFKQRFDPVWTANYLACPGGFDAPRVLLEVNGLISGGMRGLVD
ncbi:bifunctional lysylphosphatidylglycerol flippase/synthetase MprF [Oricola nitratireducens]|uniref:bifunctional lysylphosphatidylglycerol flippase/synthetase MprF n=1 Tax=Oricola nitratireducens TaxID=2775868 RepID=UPI0018663C37|nr:bifunctional lysylphosphatidylglycerol flippase/synthetase MprF [Oricola nitratireducens]